LLSASPLPGSAAAPTRTAAARIDGAETNKDVIE
jgi:hypothetical protein